MLSVAWRRIERPCGERAQPSTVPSAAVTESSASFRLFHTVLPRAIFGAAFRLSKSAPGTSPMPMTVWSNFRAMAPGPLATTCVYRDS